MEIRTSFLIGGVKYEFNFEEPKELDGLHKSTVLSNPKTHCNICDNAGKENFKLDSNKDKEGNTYINVLCMSCGAKSKLGQYKTGGYFWKDFEKFERQTTQKQPASGRDFEELL